jgi:hypothetical protein
MCIHLKYDENTLIKTFEPTDRNDFEKDVIDFILNSDICLGILPKKGNASVKSMLKCYKQEESYI